MLARWHFTINWIEYPFLEIIFTSNVRKENYTRNKSIQFDTKKTDKKEQKAESPVGVERIYALPTAQQVRGLFLESPGNLTGPKSYFEIKVSRKVGCLLSSNQVHFVSLANNFTVQFSNLLKLPSVMENNKA